MFAIEKFEVKQEANSVAKEMVKSQGKYKKIGSGGYGEVYGSKASNVVYKIGDASDNVGYLAFIKVLAKQKQDNPFLPKIYGVRFIKDSKGDEVFVVAMEKLVELPGRLREVRDWITEELENSGENGTRNAEVELGVKKVMPKPLAEALNVLRAAHKAARSNSPSDYWSDNADWDLHGGNFMARGKQIVVIDPLA